MPAFEPSTWAEVEEALASRKASAQDIHPFVTQVRAFTNAPERFLSCPESPVPASPPRPTPLTDVLSSDGEDASAIPEHPRPVPRKRPRPPLSHIKRNDGQFDDLLGLGRVDIETTLFVRRYMPDRNVDDFSITPTSLVAKNFSSSPLNPSSHAFDPALYLTKIHHATSLDDLIRGKAALTKLRLHFDAEAEECRGHKYISAALVEAAFETTKHNLRPISPFASNCQGIETGARFQAAEATLKARYEDVVCREKKLARLRRTLAVYTRYQWIFGLGAQLRSSITEGMSSIEAAAREYLRGLKWLKAQDGAHLALIQNDMDDAFNYFIASLLNNLSISYFSHQETTRLFAVLSLVKREDLLIEALSIRMKFALEGLHTSTRVVDVGASLDIKSDLVKSPRETSDLITRASTAFLDGLSHVWRLGRVMMGQERWLCVVDAQFLHLSQSFAAILQEHLMANVSLKSRHAVGEIASVRRKVMEELQIPVSCLKPVIEAHDEITAGFLRSVGSSVETNVRRLASYTVEAELSGTEAAQRLYSILFETMGLLDESMIQPDDAGVKFAGETMDSQERESTFSPDRNPPDIHSVKYLKSIGFDLNMLGKTCAQLPGVFTRQVYDLVHEKDSTLDSKALRLAVCASELLSGVAEGMWKKVEQKGLFDRRFIRSCRQESEAVIRDILSSSTNTYVDLVSKPLQKLAGGMVSFREEELEDSVSKTVPIEIEGISRSANEVTLQLALITIDTRRNSTNASLLRSILLSLIRGIGTTLVDVLSTDKLVYHRAAQLWVDVTYMQDMMTKGADSDTLGLQDALEGYSRVKERAVQAVLADGYSFSLADMSVLRESVVATGIHEAQMVSDCYRETWTSLRSPEVLSLK